VCGVGVAWLSGLVIDVTFGTLLAQHALAAAFVIYLTAKFHLQLRAFPFSQLAATVLGLLAIYRFILLWINGVAGITVPAINYWAPVLVGAILWPILASVLPPLVDNARSRS
jgi:rod shape-determining protein MreD